MTAKEYLAEKVEHDDTMLIYGYDIATLIEDYHQAKLYEITEEKKHDAAHEYEKNASCGDPMVRDYVNEDFIAGINWALSKLKGDG